MVASSEERNLLISGLGENKKAKPFSIQHFEKLLERKKESFWMEMGAKKALLLFHQAAEKVPAYKDFLKKNRINHKKIKTSQDFKAVPWTDKKNYITSYPLVARLWEGNITDSNLIAVSSGTSGAPTFWPRGAFQEFEASIIHELIYRYLFHIDKYRSTLLVIGFPMGVYVSGVATLLPSLEVARKYGMTVVSVGNNKEELLRVVQSLTPEYDQVILAGHPFFIKDAIETGKSMGVNWRRKKLRLMFCSEGFSEGWRQYLLREAGIRDECNAISTYGASELLLIGHETKFTISLRKIFEKNLELRRKFTRDGLVPSIFQYNPIFRFIENMGAELVFTSASGIPLIRFNLHDNGRVIPLREVRLYAPIGSAPLWNLPLVSLSGRSDQTIIFYAANIYPEHIHAALNHPWFLKTITGKFTMRKGYRKNMDEYLEIHIELRDKRGEKLKRNLHDKIIRTLQAVNMEYRDALSRFGKKAEPRVILHPYQDANFFKPGIKPRYILK